MIKITITSIAALYLFDTLLVSLPFSFLTWEGSEIKAFFIFPVRSKVDLCRAESCTEEGRAGAMFGLILLI